MAPLGQIRQGSPAGPQQAPATIAGADQVAPVGQIFLPKRFDRAFGSSQQSATNSVSLTITSDEYSWLIERMTIITGVASAYDLSITVGGDSQLNLVEAYNNVQTGTFTVQETRPIRVPPNSAITFTWISVNPGLYGKVRLQYIAGLYVDAPYGLGGVQ